MKTGWHEALKPTAYIQCKSKMAGEDVLLGLSSQVQDFQVHPIPKAWKGMKLFLICWFLFPSTRNVILTFAVNKFDSSLMSSLYHCCNLHAWRGFLGLFMHFIVSCACGVKAHRQAQSTFRLPDLAHNSCIWTYKHEPLTAHKSQAGIQHLTLKGNQQPSSQITIIICKQGGKGEYPHKQTTANKGNLHLTERPGWTPT